MCRSRKMSLGMSGEKRQGTAREAVGVDTERMGREEEEEEEEEEGDELEDC